MKISILKHMQIGALYFREELEPFTKRIDFELAHLMKTGEIKKCHQGIYAKQSSEIDNELLINKIISRDRELGHLIIPASRMLLKTSELSDGDYICLNHKRADLILTSNFKIKFQIPTHGFPKKLTENFIIIHQLNSSSDISKTIKDFKLNLSELNSDFIRDLKKYGNKKTFKFLSDRILKEQELKNISEDLSTIGAPLIISINIKSSKIFSKEKILSDALSIGLREPRIHNILPFTILKNASDIDFGKLQDLTKENGTYRYAGFILDLLRKAGYENIPEFKAPKYSKIPMIPFKEIYGKRGLERLKSDHLDFALGKWGILIDSKIEAEREKIRKWS